MLKRALFLCALFLPGLCFAEVEISTATGNKITYDGMTGIATIEGNAVVYNATATMSADMIHLDAKSKTGRASGNIKIIQSSSTLTGSEAEYYWESGTGTIHNVSGENGQFRFTAEEAQQISPDFFIIEDAMVTSCDLTPPHYHIHSNHGTMRRGKRITLKNAEFVPEETPSFWMPIYSKSLIPKKYKLRIEPGSTGRDGFTAKTVFGYPFTPHTWTNIRWDYLERTGNGFGLEHIYNTPTVRGDFDSYYIRDDNPDVEVPESKRYTVLWNHYQKLTSRLSFNGKLDVKSDQTFGNQFSNVGNQVYVENQDRGLLSEGGFTYQLPLVTFQAQASRQDKFDSTVSSHQFISHLVLPTLSFNTAPLTGKHVPFYSSFNGSFTNETVNRTSPEQNLSYKKNATGGVEMKKEIRLPKKTWTLTPLLGFNENWDSRVLSSTGVNTEHDQYTSRYRVGMDARRRYFRRLDLKLGYRYGGRTEVNNLHQDNLADDYGVETNQLNGSFQVRVGRSTLYTLSSGYDFRNDPRSQPDKYNHQAARVTPPALDMQYEVKKNMNVYFRETYGLFDPATNTIVHTPINTSGELQLGGPNAPTLFTQGFSYTKKTNPTDDSQLFLNNKFKFYLSPSWYVDLFISYRAVGPSKMNYSKVLPIEKSVRIVRDLHCWVLRAQFGSRPGVTEASFYIDLKTNLSPAKNVFTGANDSVYSTRNDGPTLDQIFPSDDTSATTTPPTSTTESTPAPVPAQTK